MSTSLAQDLRPVNLIHKISDMDVSPGHAATSDAGALYGAGSRGLQDAFDSRRLADRLLEITVQKTIDDRTRRFFEESSYFFLSTVDRDGFPDVSYKGGRPGFVAVVDERTLRFPSYDGNGMYRSLGNIVDTGKVGMLFIRQNDKAARIRVHGTARVLTTREATAAFDGAEAVVEVTLGRAFPNCPRYVHDLAADEISEYVPAPGYEPPVPEWKQMDIFEGFLPRRDPR